MTDNQSDNKWLQRQRLARQSMSVDKMLQVLQFKGQVECNSAKNRQRLYKLLQQRGIKYQREVIGYTVEGSAGIPTHRQAKNKCTPAKLAKWIIDKRVTRKDIEVAYEDGNWQQRHYHPDTDPLYDISGLAPIFASRHYSLIRQTIENDDKHGSKYDLCAPLTSHIYYHKTVARITIINRHSGIEYC